MSSDLGLVMFKDAKEEATPAAYGKLDSLDAQVWFGWWVFGMHACMPINGDDDDTATPCCRVCCGCRVLRLHKTSSCAASALSKLDAPLLLLFCP